VDRSCHPHSRHTYLASAHAAAPPTKLGTWPDTIMRGGGTAGEFFCEGGLRINLRAASYDAYRKMIVVKSGVCYIFRGVGVKNKFNWAAAPRLPYTPSLCA